MKHIEYFEVVKNMVKEIEETQFNKIDEAANIIANTVIDGGIIHTFGSGHSHQIAEDMAFRTGSLAPVHAIIDLGVSGSVEVLKAGYVERLEGYGNILFNYHKITKPDCLVIVSNSGRNPVTIDLAMEAQKNNISVISIVSMRYAKSFTPRHSNGKMLHDVSDIVLDNCGVENGDATLKIEGFERKFGPTSTITSAFITNAMMAKAIELIYEKGVTPPVFVGGNQDGGMETNEILVNKYWDKCRNF